MPFPFFGLLLHPKTTHLSGIFFLAIEADCPKQDWNDVTNRAIPRLLKAILLLGRVLKKCAFYDL